MSGPTTAIVVVPEPATALLAAAAIQAAAAIRESHARAAELRGENEAARRNDAALQKQSRLDGQQSNAEALNSAEARFDRLLALADRLGIGAAVRTARPLRPAEHDPQLQADYFRTLELMASELESFLLTEAARRKDDLADFPDFALTTTLARETVAPTPSQRLLARIAHLGTPPDTLLKLAHELDSEPPGERANLLATELRHQIQRHAEAVQKEKLEAAKALIVEQTLKDLGYQVEEIGATLFVEGGVVHFRKPGWDDYMVRMRIDAAGGTANFNVVRAVEAGNNERSVRDHIAEDRWCAEFPALLKALEARGMRLDVTRRLDAGELPVQLVSRDRLPRFAEEENTQPKTELQAREIK